MYLNEKWKGDEEKQHGKLIIITSLYVAPDLKFRGVKKTLITTRVNSSGHLTRCRKGREYREHSKLIMLISLSVAPDKVSRRQENTDYNTRERQRAHNE